MVYFYFNNIFRNKRLLSHVVYCKHIFSFFLRRRNKLTQSKVGPSEQILSGRKKMSSFQKIATEIATAIDAHKNVKQLLLNQD